MNKEDIKLLEDFNIGIEGDLYIDKKDWIKIKECEDGD